MRQMSEDRNVTTPASGPPSPHRDPLIMLQVINGVLMSMATLYVATKSITITLIGAAVAAVLAALYFVTRKP
jgi:hypothetical protein